MKNNTRYIIAIILILIICWFGYTYTEDINKTYSTHKPFKQQLQRFIWLISVGLITWWAFAKNSKKWISVTVWIVYGVVIFSFGVLGIIEWKYKIFSENFKEFIAGIRLFLSSPLPFIFLWFLTTLKFNSFNKS